MSKPTPVLAETDLLLERVVPVDVRRVWRAWTVPRHVQQWLTPAPWKTTEVDIDLRPGGRFYFAMQGPEGETGAYEGCVLEIVPEQRLVWTLALGPGYRPTPVPEGVPQFTAVITLQPEGSGTRYRALALHRDPGSAQVHADMGFADGWGAALDQLVARAAEGAFD